MVRILYAEDDDQMRAFLSRAMQNAGHEVYDFCDGRHARDFFDSHADKIDLILTDIVMPGIDGFELAAYARRARPDIPVIYMTGFSAIGEEGSPQGQILQKPLHIRDILRQIDDLTRPKE